MMNGKAVRQKLIGSDDERAVSPVIGVILMVAITVILAAVIAAFVLDMGGSQSAPAQAGVSVEEADGDNNMMEVTIQSMGDNTERVECVGDDTGDSADVSSASSVGKSFKCSSDSNIIAVSEDGSRNIIQEDI